MTARTDAPPPALAAPESNRWIAMTILLAAGFMNLIDVTIVNVALPSLQTAFAATSAQIEWVVAGYILVFALCLLPGGRFGDIFGRRAMFLWGVAVFTLGSAACGLAPSMPALVAARVLQGIGGGMMTPQTLAIVPALFRPEERGAPFALFGLTAGLASVTGPLLGGLLIGADLWGLGWRPIFLVNIPIGIAAILAARRFIPKVPGTSGLRVDGVGIVLAGVALLLVVFPLIEGRQAGWPWPFFAMLGLALPAGALFVRWEAAQSRRGGAQLLPMSLLRSRTFLLGSGMISLLFSGVPGLLLLLALYLQSGYGLTPLASGLTTLPFSLGILVASPFNGMLGIRWLRVRPAVGASLLAVAMVWLRVAVGGTADSIVWAALAPPLFLAGLGLGATISPLFQTVLARIEGSDIGSASGALRAFQQVGSALGVAVVGQIFFTSLGAAPRGSHAAYDAALAFGLMWNTAVFAAVAGLCAALPGPVR